MLQVKKIVALTLIWNKRFCILIILGVPKTDKKKFLNSSLILSNSLCRVEVSNKSLSVEEKNSR